MARYDETGRHREFEEVRRFLMGRRWTGPEAVALIELIDIGAAGARSETFAEIRRVLDAQIKPGEYRLSERCPGRPTRR